MEDLRASQATPTSPMAMIRASRGLRQLDVALLTGLNPSTIYLAEKHGRVSRRTKRKIARVLGVEPDLLFQRGA